MRSPSDQGADWASAYHVPVLATEVSGLLAGLPSILDGTLGGGGHAETLLAGGARVTGIDRDPDAVRAASERLHAYRDAGTFRALVGNFADVGSIASLAGEQFDGIVLDLGVSSHQLDDPLRGFSFREGAPLDMRMGTDATSSGARLLNSADERELAFIFKEFGDEPRAYRLAREIVRRRGVRPFATSDDLVGAIRGALGARTGPPDFARLFQAVRIAVNDELAALERGLPVLRDRLRPGGVFVVIAYHSGEDRIVKQAFRDWSRACVCPPRQPICTCGGTALGELLTKRPLSAHAAEIARNPRARSARLRAWRSAR
ncbi:MAG TPA: 16S rRNA (cytosine(1402)-N(4))-methyltransferase RsmH [Gemmatimonadaceae bacterium]|nr:16S rRNA (cytosine(1402)-N(4))-methyltransferase RsmH [Gemmatimonadaceae bacterium]